MNQVVDACTTAATAASDRFIHLEQSRDLRGQPEAVANAIAAALR